MIPAKLVKRGEYVDMAELLKDNMEAERHRSIQEEGSASLGTCSCPRREIPDALSWTYCISIFAAIICAKWPQRIGSCLPIR